MRKILVIQPKMIGDVLASSVICQAIKQWDPSCEVHYLINRNTLPVVENNPFVDRFVLTDASSGPRDSVALGWRLSREGYDAIIDVYGKWETVILAVLSGAKRRIGYRKWYTSMFYTDVVRQKQGIQGSAIYHRLQLASQITGLIAGGAFPKIYLTDTEKEAARKQLEQVADTSLPVIMISVLGSGANKSLPVPQMAEVLDEIASSGKVQMLFNYIPSQKAQAMEIFAACSPSTQAQILPEFYADSLRGFIAILSCCDALIGNEGGAVNMAKALGVPTFTIFSPWINKDSWNMLEDGDRHVAVHLNDYYPDLYNGQHPKRLKPRWESLYRILRLELYREKLQRFVLRVTRI